MITVFLYILALSNAAMDCPKNFNLYVRGNLTRCYHYNNTLETFYEAYLTCNLSVSHLAEPKSAAENDLLYNLTKNKTQGIWIGIKNVTYMSDSQPLVWSNWAKQNIHNRAEDCVRMRGPLKDWKYEKCYDNMTMYPFFCEVNPIEKNTTQGQETTETKESTPQSRETTKKAMSGRKPTEEKRTQRPETTPNDRETTEKSSKTTISTVYLLLILFGILFLISSLSYCICFIIRKKRKERIQKQSGLGKVNTSLQSYTDTFELFTSNKPSTSYNYTSEISTSNKPSASEPSTSNKASSAYTYTSEPFGSNRTKTTTYKTSTNPTTNNSDWLETLSTAIESTSTQ